MYTECIALEECIGLHHSWAEQCSYCLDIASHRLPPPVACVGLLKTKIQTKLVLSIINTCLRNVDAKHRSIKDLKMWHHYCCKIWWEIKWWIRFYRATSAELHGRAIAKPLPPGVGTKHTLSHCAVLCWRNSCQFRATVVTPWRWDEWKFKHWTPPTHTSHSGPWN